MHDTQTPIDTRGPVAYKLRAEQYPWAEVGTMIGSEAASRNVIAASLARAHARAKGRPWPPPNTLGEKVYSMFSQDKAWTFIETALGRSLKDLKRFGRKYAKEQGLTWPPPSNTGHSAYVQAKRGLTWEEIGEHLTRDPKEVREAAKGWALSKDIAWPLPSVSRMMRRAYLLYERTQMSWIEVATLLGYSHPAHAVEGARKCAQVMGWTWPLAEGGRRGPSPKEPEEMSGCMPYHDIMDGDVWEVVQTRYDYGYMHNLKDACRRYAERANLPWPPYNESDAAAG